VSEVPGAASRVFRKSHFFGVVIDTIKLKNNATAHRVKSDTSFLDKLELSQRSDTTRSVERWVWSGSVVEVEVMMP